MASATMEERVKNLLSRNTFFTKALKEDEEEYQILIAEIVRIMKELREKTQKLDTTRQEDRQKLREVVADILQTEKHGLNAMLTLCGLSDEKLYRIISFLRISYKQGLYKSDSEWLKIEKPESEWKEDVIKRFLKEKRDFALDLAKIFLGWEEYVINALSPYERKTLDEKKFLFKNDSLLETLAIYGLRGSYNAMKGKGPERIVEDVLKKMNVMYEEGKGLKKDVGRDMDWVIPSKRSPKIFIQILFNETTSSEMGDKARAERDIVAKNIRERFPEAILVLFVDGAGWLARVSDLKTMLEATPYVFTFHEECLEEFKKLLKQKLPKECYKQNLTKFFSHPL